VSCEHDTRRVTRTEYDGKITVLVDKFDGKPLNSPNDIVVKSDDSLWFTDPPLGILGNYEGHVATPELPTNVYRVGKSGRVAIATGEVNRPNGLAFSPDELPERCANVCFGGVKRNRLFMAASHSVYSLFTGTQGVKGG
jgi:gluconolactonase